MSMLSKPPSSRSKVLIFAPYGSWTVHHQLDAVLGAALRLRGADVTALLCDGVFDSCPLAGRPANADTCRACAAAGSSLFGALGVPTAQLRSLLQPGDQERAAAWAEGLAVDALADAEFDGLPLGRFVSSSVHGWLMTGHLDPRREEWTRFHRRLLANSAIVASVMSRMLDLTQPDALICFNGIQAYYRVALEVARRRGVRILSHERGLAGGWTLLADGNYYETQARLAAWPDWQDVPLSVDECAEVKKYLAPRESAQGDASSLVFYKQTHDGRDLRRALRLPDDARLVGLFTTSDWEIGIGRGHFPMTFDSQIEWIEQTARTVAQRDAYLVVRHHPNMFQPGYDARLFFEELSRLDGSLPANVRMVMPYEPITSYGVLQNVELALSCVSTIGVEALLRGIPSYSVGDYFGRHAGVRLLESRSGYEAALLDALDHPQPPTVAEVARAYRFCHMLYLKLSRHLDSVAIGDAATLVNIRLQTLDELAPGRDAVLDQVCSFVLEATPLHPRPGRVTADAGAEQAFVVEELERERARREQVRGFRSPQRGGDTTVAVICPAVAPQAGEPLTTSPLTTSPLTTSPLTTSPLTTSLARSRHRAMVRVPLIDAEWHDGTSLVGHLSRSLTRTTAPFVHVAQRETRVEESVYATAVDALSDDEGAVAAVFGSWICAADGAMVDELFTTRRTPTPWREAIAAAPMLLDPLRVLSLAVWRRPALASLLARFHGAARLHRSHLAEAVYTRLFFAEAGAPAMVRSPGPFFAWTPPDSATPLARDLAFVSLYAGDAANAEPHLARALAEDPADRQTLLKYLELLPFPSGIARAAGALCAYLELDPDDAEIRALAAGLVGDAALVA